MQHLYFMVVKLLVEFQFRCYRKKSGALNLTVPQGLSGLFRNS